MCIRDSPGEVHGLHVCDVVEDNAVKISRAVNVRSEVTTGKNESALRCVALCPMAKEVVDAQIKLLGRASRSAFLFPMTSYRTYYNRWKRYCLNNGIAFVSPYEMRHSFISYAKSIPKGDLQLIVGHTPSMDTFGTYSQSISGDMQRIAKNVEYIFENLLQSQEANEELK